jgi:hypothetical protein
VRLALAAHRVWPSVFSQDVGTPKYPPLAQWGMDYAAQYLACTYPCQRFVPALAGRGA